jgi:predicted anti-sigma-YlaC factor YlaD
LSFDCRSVRQHLSDAHDGALPRLERTLIRWHLKACAECAPVNESLKSTLALLGKLRG